MNESMNVMLFNPQKTVLSWTLMSNPVTRRPKGGKKYMYSIPHPQEVECSIQSESIESGEWNAKWNVALFADKQMRAPVYLGFIESTKRNLMGGGSRVRAGTFAYLFISNISY